MRRGRHVVPQTISGKVERIDGIHHVVGIEPGVLIGEVRLVNRERDGLGQALGKVRPTAIFKGQVLAPVGGVRVGVIVLNEAARAAHHVQAHQLPPVIGMLALLEGRQGAYGALVLADELGFAHLAELPLGANPQVFVFLHEQAQLTGEVKIGLVVWRGGQQDTLAFVLLDVLLNRAVTFTFAIT